MRLQPSQMFCPGFRLDPLDFRILELQEHVTEIFGKRFSQETPDILKDKRFGANRPDDAHRMGKHVTLVTIALVLAPDRKRLAWEVHQRRVQRGPAIVQSSRNARPC